METKNSKKADLVRRAVALARSGKTPSEVGAELGISPHQVSSWFGRLRKLGVSIPKYQKTGLDWSGLAEDLK